MNDAGSARTIAGLVLMATTLAAGPVYADIDLSGEWSNRYSEDSAHRGAGPEVGDYTGLPINEAARQKAESWDASVLSLKERQCIPHVVVYALRGPSNFRMWKDTDPATGRVVAYHIYGSYGRPRTIWLDGRPHPPVYAPHTWTGFSTGQWEGDTLKVTTTHIKMGWVQRNGVPTSDEATLTEYFIRHGDMLSILSIVDDPIYLSEPLIRSTEYVLNLTQQISSFGVCGPAQIADELIGHPKGYVPHHLPGENNQLREFTSAHGVQPVPALGGAETTYPEYMATLREGAAARAPTSGADVSGTSRDRAARRQQYEDGDVHVLPVQGSVYMLVGAGGNIAVQIGDEGVLLVDTGSGAVNDKVLAAIRRLSDKPIRYILNTDADADHVGGNEALAKAGSRIGTVMVIAALAGQGASIIAHEKVLNAMSAPTGKQAPTPAGAWPTDTYFTDSKAVYFNDEAIQLFHQPSAHTDGDSVVFFRRSDVVSTGDVFDLTGYPFIDAQKGGTFSGVLDALNRLVDLTIPKDWQEGGTMVIPGHGRLADQADLVEYRDMLTIIRDRIQAMIKKGMTLEQVKAARPTLDYDGRYGSRTGAWTTDTFIEAAYRDLTRRRP
jgi:glyoxylase-like metal-dependent hydrolase (beta-lactamase superfamily II)